MAITKIQGLRGLNGLGSLSVEDKTKWMEANASRLPKASTVSPYEYQRMADRIYRNDLFRQKFASQNKDDALLKSLSPEDRDNLYKSTLVGEEFTKRFGNNANIDELNELSIDGKIDLLGSDYMSDAEFSKYKQDQEGVKQEINDALSGKKGFFETLGWLMPSAMATPLGGTHADATKEAIDDKISAKEKSNADELAKVVAADNDRIKEQSAAPVNEYLQSLLKQIDDGILTTQQVDAAFSQIADGDKVNPGSNYYKQFKDSKEFENFSLTDKLRTIAQYYYISDNYSPYKAFSMMDQDMRNYVSDHQTATDWATNTLKNIWVGGVANLANKVMGAEALALYSKAVVTGDWEEYTNFLEGKDTDGSELSWYNNPEYWQGVDQFNTFDAAEINKARERGGVSKYNNITLAGHDMDFLSWNTFNETVKMGKYIWSEALAARLGGKVGGLVGKIPKVGGVLSKGAAIGTVAQSALGDAEAEGLSSYQDALQSMTEQLDKTKQSELRKYQKSLLDNKDTFNTSQAKNFIENWKDNYIKSHQNSEGTVAFVDDTLTDMAKRAYAQSLSSDYSKQLDTKYADAYKQAEESAAQAYATTATIKGVKSALNNFVFQKWMLSKETKQALGDNGLGNISVRSDAKGKLSLVRKGLNRAKAVMKSSFGEGVDEWSDSFVNNTGQGLALADFNDYLKKKYNPKDYVEVSDNVVSHFLTGLEVGASHAFDRQALYEGFIGALSPFTNVTPNVGALRSENRGQSFRTDAKGNRLSLAESLSKYIINPVLNTYADVRRQEREAQVPIDAVNKAVEDSGEDLLDITRIVRRYDDYSRASEGQSVFNAKEAKAAQAFEIVSLLSTMSRSPIAEQSTAYQNAMSTLRQVASDNMNEDAKNNLITQFLGQGENKSIVERDDAKEVAWNKLKKNATDLLSMYDGVTEISERLNSSLAGRKLSSDVKAQLTFQLAMNENWKKRLGEIEETLKGTSQSEINGVKPGNSENELLARFGNKKEVEVTRQAETKVLERTNKRLEDVKSQIKTIEENKEGKDADKLPSLRQQQRTLESRKAELEEDLKENGTLDAAAKLFSNDDTRVLTEQEILNLNAEDRATMLLNKHRYSTEQQKVIDETMGHLKAKDPDVADKIKDASSLNLQLRANNEAYRMIMDNPEAANSYASMLRSNMYERAKAIFEEKRSNAAQSVIGAIIQQDNGAEMLRSVTEVGEEDNKLSITTSDIKAYAEQHPEAAESLNPIINYRQFVDDAASAIATMSLSEGGQDALVTSVKNIIAGATTKEEAVAAIERAIDSEGVNAVTQSILNSMLEEMVQVGYQRDATVLQNRKERQQREAQLQQEREQQEAKRKEAEAAAKPKPSPTLGESSLEDVSLEDEAPASQEQGTTTETTNQEQQPSATENTPTEKNLNEDTVEDVDLSEAHTTTTIEEEVKTTNAEVVIQPTAKTDEVETANSENPSMPSSTLMISNPYYRYVLGPLKTFGKLVLRAATTKGDKLDTIFSWFDTMGIKLQEIIDNELNAIKALNPDVQYIFVKPQENAMNDVAMQRELLQVVEYTDKVKKIHREERGGVIKANGKEWLVIGIQRWSNPLQMELFNSMAHEMRVARKQYFDSNPNERFYVNDKYRTKIADIAPGRLVRQLLTDEAPKMRTISELLKDKARNLKGLKFEDLKWGIQKGGKFATVGVSSRNRVYSPTDAEGNNGAIFLLVESANGGYIPAKIKATMLTELRDGTYKTELYNLLNRLLSPSHSDRVAAIKQLVQRLVLDENNNILIGDANHNTVSIKKDGVIIKTFDLSHPDFTTQDFIDAVNTLNPRIHIGLSSLSNVTTLQQLDEAGALTTDIAMLGTANANHSVYACDSNGKPIIEEPIINTPSTDSDYNRKQQHSVLLLGKTYREIDGTFYDEVDKPITDPRMIAQLSYNQKIQASGLQPIKVEGTSEYYIIDSDKGVVIKRDANSHVVTTLSENTAKEFIENIAKEQAEEAREEAIEANRKAAEDGRAIQTNIENIPLTDDIIEEQMRGEFRAEPQEQSEEQSKEIDESSKNSNDNGINGSARTFAEQHSEQKVTSFSDILNSSEFGDRLDEIIDEKIESGVWEDVPDDIGELEAYLNAKGITTVGITDINAWLDMVQNCK